VPMENVREAAVVDDIEVFGVGSLAQAATFLGGETIPGIGVCRLSIRF